MSYVLLHGFSGQPAALTPLAAALGEPHALAPLIAGHGHAPCPVSGPAAFEHEVDRLSVQIAARSRGPVELVGYSLGARLALGIALRHPRLVASLALLGVNPGLQSAAERAERRAADLQWASLLEREGLVRFAEAWEQQPLFRGRVQLARALRLGHQPAHLASAMRELGLANMPDYWSRLPELSMPVALLAGAEDPKFVAIAKAMRRAAPRLAVFTVAGAAHNLPLERPRAVSHVVSSLHSSMRRTA